METLTEHEINVLLTQAGHFRHAASATSQPAYRATMLKTARQLEAKASEIEAQPETHRRTEAAKTEVPK
jgi:hypothetical protein